MTKYFIKCEDKTLDNKIINYFIDTKSIQRTIFLMNDKHKVVVSRQEVKRLLKENNLSDKIKTRTTKNVVKND